MRFRAWSQLLASIPFVVALASCAHRAPGVPHTDEPTYDLVIENGRVIDGTGAAWFYGDVAVTGDRIAQVTPRGFLRSAKARDRINAKGMVVAPGFIDIQSHSRSRFLDGGDGRVVSKVMMGVTTEIMGEGSTNAIVNATSFAGDTANATARQSIARYGGQHGFGNWLDDMQRHGASVNFGSFLGGNNVRMYAMGSRQGEATVADLDSMRKVVRWAMEGGAFGIGTALIYPPGTFATTEELIEASRAMAPYGGIYITHLRSEADEYLEALDEAITIGREAGVAVEIYHLKAAGRKNWHKAAQAIARIDSARAAGIDAQANMYPYIAGGAGLSACLPPWASENNKMFDNIANTAVRARIRAEMLIETSSWENVCALAGPDGVLLSRLGSPQNSHFSGLRLSEVAARGGKHWVDAVLDLILSERSRVEAVFFLMSEENVKLQLLQPWMKFGTDAGGVNPDSSRGLVHPRAYGTFTRILGKYVRDEKVITLEDAVRKMTSAVAIRLKIPNRGLLLPGMFADVVVFDPLSVADRATFEEPHQLSTGVHYVFVNGTAVVRKGIHTGALPGRALRGPGHRAAEVHTPRQP